MPGVSGSRGVALAAVLKAHVILNGRDCLLLALYSSDRMALAAAETTRFNLTRGADVGLPDMVVVIIYAPTRDQLMEASALAITGKTEMHRDMENPRPGPLRINARVGPDRETALILGLSGDNLLELGAGAVWTIDGEEMNMPGYQVVLLGCEPDDEVTELLSRTGAHMPDPAFGYVLHEHQPPVLIERNERLAEIMGDGELRVYAEIDAGGVPLKMWTAKAGPGYGCCDKGMG